MTGTRARAPRPPQRRHRGLLVLALLAGLLGMHALAPGGGMAHAGVSGPARAAHGAVAVSAPDDCPDAAGHCGGHRLHHADPSCASGALDGGPQLPVPAPDPAAVVAPAACPRPGPATAPDGARAPPDLTELQLLRI
ncbi:hypothetical protein GCM10010300_48960 [Streptomyces olivaceoviridis]|uniref:DUF6153 family protein n=1 Tax=Streptomyces olivaceoviridis TaxID=1921 RepID=UPI001675DA19|nr:DUF6153 family protein [Streptomyces olivaceoviridis]GGY99253.1 hypothetical protein GCM10010300_48960 [Streptomyces olivaceoviridis]